MVDYSERERADNFLLTSNSRKFIKSTRTEKHKTILRLSDSTNILNFRHFPATKRFYRFDPFIVYYRTHFLARLVQPQGVDSALYYSIDIRFHRVIAKLRFYYANL